MPKGIYSRKKRKYLESIIAKVPEEPSSPKSQPVPLSTGTERVRMDFKSLNNDSSHLILMIKTGAADLINICQHMKGREHPQALELERLCSLAQVRFEEAAMWAVKAATL
jgi:hypothetical protein